ncbi:NifU family protein [Rickettsiales endosymbiont of Stachyamoeba lipophora]|uniref:NifU family protein n=1 Tax=Rickettsiales endosymbiont of Stachyamoeba lipophora TaxID=2486578 RepID=UPI000F648D8B|nr:NifU family protein [Rickettsiales endosymbiont of Stachyamoeba lipophora]AZL15162.1 NifU family protein [Rickettsiales endosymbiont of Stachyamoeba lipophora]
MFIQIETTPNPQTLKFIPGIEVTGGEPFNFPTKETAHTSPLAQILFEIPDVASVFLGFDFVTITKKDQAEWDTLKPILLATIMDHFISNKPVLSADQLSTTSTSQINANDSEIVKQIKEIIETKVRPAVAQDGGDIVYHSFEDGVVKLELHGSCSGCPSSTITLKNGIENMLKHYVPEVEAVEAIQPHEF